MPLPQRIAKSVLPALALALAALTACAHRLPTLETQAVARGDLVQSVTASGTVNPRDTVLVGTQVSGTIQEIRVDFNSVVHRGEVLALLDPSTFKAALAQARANLAQAEAQRDAMAGAAHAARESAAASAYARTGAEAGSASALNAAASARARRGSAEAMVAKQRSALALAQTTLRRDRELLAKGYVAQSVADADAANVVATRAALQDAEATARQAGFDARAAENQAAGAAAQAQQQLHVASGSLAQSRSSASSYAASQAAVAAAREAVRQAALNLSHATIVSPVDGTVVARNVSVGQTVAAALQAPTLFTIATDLRKMEVDVAVGEPDVGAVRAGQPVALTVLAYPHRVFRGTVAQVRQNPTVTQNVTTYAAVIYVDNPDGSLRPGMTANATISVARFADALIVPLNALRWKPTAEVRKAYGVPEPASTGAQGKPGSAWGQTGVANAAAATPGSTATAWVREGRTLRAVAVTVLGVSGTSAAVAAQDGALRAGDEVVVGESTPEGSARS